MKKTIATVKVLSFLFLTVACTDSLAENTTSTVYDTETELTYSDWTEESHSKNGDRNYDVVFNQEVVQRIDLVISATNWASMQAELKEKYGTSNGGGGNPGSGPGGGNPGGGPGGGNPGGGPGGGNPGGGMDDLDDEDWDPTFVSCELFYEGKEWYKVGVRYKGNSSLRSAYQSGNGKLSLKLDFDEFEEEMPDEYQNQRFYGFKQLNLNNNYNDGSFLHEKMAADLFRSFGVPAACTSYYEVYIDNGDGNGPQYFGLYTMVEEVDNTLIKNKTFFSSSKGNLYKPESDIATFKLGSYSAADMYTYKKTNEDVVDCSDAEALYNAINNTELMNSDREAWRTELESVFNVDVFLRWLAANTVIQNWDTYGNMTHNYFLYDGENNGILTWIAWDNNEAFTTGQGNHSALSLDMSEVTSDWPLIYYMMKDDRYKATYQTYLRKFCDECFIPSVMQAKYDSWAALIKPYAIAERSGYTYLASSGRNGSLSSAFDSNISAMKSQVTTRSNDVDSYLSFSTSIDSKVLLQKNDNTNSAIYNLCGQRMENKTRGLYVINGKKTVIR